MTWRYRIVILYARWVIPASVVGAVVWITIMSARQHDWAWVAINLGFVLPVSLFLAWSLHAGATYRALTQSNPPSVTAHRIDAWHASDNNQYAEIGPDLYLSTDGGNTWNVIARKARR